MPLIPAGRMVTKIKRSARSLLLLHARPMLLGVTMTLAIFTIGVLAWVQVVRLERPSSPISTSLLYEKGASLSNDHGTAQMLSATDGGEGESDGEEGDERNLEEEGDGLDVSMAERDATQRYAKHTFVVPATAWRELSHRPVCLATHASVDHLHHVADTAPSWRGPISVAVFAPDLDYQLARIYIRYMRKCFPGVLRKVSFHVAYPVDRAARWEPGSILNADFDNCSEPALVLQKLLENRPKEMMDGWRKQLPYPQNLMRNLARSTCTGKYVICPDVDMVVTVDGLDEQLAEFLEREEQKSCTRCAYTLPVYELREMEDPPANKTQLLRLINKKQARPFHVRVFWPNQGISNLRTWERKGEAPELDVSHAVQRFVFFYEPVYVAARDVPPFDERFVGFGHTRNTQAYEMYVADWHFFVLNNAFLVHWGFQKLSQRPPWRLKQASINARKFPNFVREVAVRYNQDPLGMLARYQSKKYHIVVKTAEAANAHAVAPVGGLLADLSPAADGAAVKKRDTGSEK